MNDVPRESFWDYREFFKERLRPAAAPQTAEPASDYREDKGPIPLNERLIQTVWAQQFLQSASLRLADGAPLRVLDAGRWNGAAGPDFKDAALMIGGETLRGDVEIHLNASDWLNHGHQRDLDYNGVILHTVLRIDDGKTFDPRHNGGRVPRLELEPYIFPDLETLRRSLTPDDFEYARPAGLGRCFDLMTHLDPAFVADFLDRAGDERLIAKMQRLDPSTDPADLEQVFHQAMMMALGSGPSKTLYYLLAKRTPLREMLDYVRDCPGDQWAFYLESLLLHVAGLVPPDEELTAAPPAARDRAERLRDAWKRFEPYWNDRVIPPTRRWYQGLRPVNFPVRRLAGVAILLERAMRLGRLPLADLIGRIQAGRRSLDRAAPTRRRHPLLKDLMDFFHVEAEGHFWSTHYSFVAAPAAGSMTLIGEGAAMSLVLNALLPVTLLFARRQGPPELAEAVRRLFALVPPLQPNHITEFMTRRLFGDTDRAEGLITTERRRQALFQIFYACCNGQERHCDDCYYFQTGVARP